MTGRRALVLATAAAVLLPALALGGWATWERTRDPVEALDRPTGELRTLHDSSYARTTTAGEERVYRELAFLTARAGTIRIALSRPPDPGGPLPMGFILGGLRTGREALDVVPDHGDNVLVAYEYPYDQDTWYENAGPGEVPAVREAVLSVPAQVAAARARLVEEPWVDPDRTSLLGYSFGALFVPAVQRLATSRGVPFRGVVLAYGGADVLRLLEANLQVGPAPVRWCLAWLAATAVRPVEPALHLPHLEGVFLIIRGRDDEKIPAASARKLTELTPEPKRVVELEAGHMRPEREELTREVVDVSQRWLAERGLIHPPRPRGGP